MRSTFFIDGKPKKKKHLLKMDNEFKKKKKMTFIKMNFIKS